MTTDTIAHRKGARRERELLAQLRRFFGDDLLTAIDRDRVRAYHTFRKADTPPAAAVTINREVDLLKADAARRRAEHLPASPPGMPRLETVAPRRRDTSEEEFARLLAVCEDAEDTAILLIGRDALVRLGDVPRPAAHRPDRLIALRARSERRDAV